MERPAAGRIRGDEIAEPVAGLDIDGVLVGAVFALSVLELDPHPVQMDRVFHHGVVDEYEAHPLPKLDADRARL